MTLLFHKHSHFLFSFVFSKQSVKDRYVKSTDLNIATYWQHYNTWSFALVNTFLRLSRIVRVFTSTWLTVAEI